MSYIDGYVLPVPRDQKALYTEIARKAAAIYKELGALELVECWADDVPHGKQTDFYRSVQASEEEEVVLSWVIWPSRKARDEGSARIMADPRMTELMKDIPVDGKRMFWGGFEPIVEMRSARP